MSIPIIQVSHVSKKFYLGPAGLTLREYFTSMMPFVSAKERIERKHIWALNDISFDVAQGECVGIVGNNGAGKSTLLRVLSGITPPTQGDVFIRGRITSLLEVGIGFSHELTGRENIFLRGTILGSSVEQTRDKFDEIVEFSGLKEFLDTPVKRYSNGMFVRLAFSVAVHLAAEILLVDEVLAVGDAEFQKKCLVKMHELLSSGRTILFVSQDMSLIKNMCQRVVTLDAGSLVRDGAGVPLNDERT